jgi:hypothetical protein
MGHYRRSGTVLLNVRGAPPLGMGGVAAPALVRDGTCESQHGRFMVHK